MICSTTRIQVRYGETDAMGITYHPNYFTWFEVGRVQLLKDIGISYKLLEAEGFALPLLEGHARFLKPTYFDDELLLESTIPCLPGARVRVEYALKRAETVVTTGYTTHAFINQKGIPVKPPEMFWRVIRAYFP